MKEKLILGDQNLMKAVASLAQRSEKRFDTKKVIETFVDSGILAQIINNNDQIIFGRRGTGKTHILQVVANEYSKEANNTVVFIDGRTLGSTSQFTDVSSPLSHRCTALFRDVLSILHDNLLTHIINVPAQEDKVNQALYSLDNLNRVMNEPIENKKEGIISNIQKNVIKNSDNIGGSIKLKTGVEINASIQNTESKDIEKQTEYKVEIEDKVRFPSLQNVFDDILTKANTRLIILFDEWSSLPNEVQPYLAEFLRRSLLPSKHIILKIASLEYRSRFRFEDSDQKVGFELGSDITANIDIDDYYVFDRNPEQITEIMADVLYKHINSETPKNYLNKKLGITSGKSLVAKLFTQRETFKELVRASEGVIRDLINIFSMAYFDCERRERQNIELKSIEQAAGEWFETDKERNLDQKLHKILSRIVDKVIGQRKARAFLVERELEKHTIIQQLSDLRIIHCIKRGWADKDNPGRRYSVFTLDYGTYVGLKNTSRQPELDLEELKDNEKESDRIVPFNDKRSIRRIILTENMLDTEMIIP